MRLHGMNVEVAQVAVFDALYTLRELEVDDPLLRQGLTIIVGKGLHSDEGMPVIGPIVSAMLQKEFDIAKLRVDEGRITVPAKELRGFWRKYTDLTSVERPRRRKRRSSGCNAAEALPVAS